MIRLYQPLLPLLLVSLATAQMMPSQNIPADLDLRTSQTSIQKLYKVSYLPQTQPVVPGKLESWTVDIRDVSGNPVDGADLQFAGRMPGHNHGLPTQPKLTKRLGGGKYQIAGVKFQMSGWWVVKIGVSSAGKTDTAEFNLLLK